MAKEINVGMVGYKFMGKAHSHAYRDVAMFFETETVPVMKVICGRTETAVSEAARRFGWEAYETSWEKIVQRQDIGLVDINTPNSTHREIAVAAAKAGKHILCEKPLAVSLAEAEEMLKAAKETGVKHMVCFNYRKIPAVGLAKKLIEEGSLGKIYHFRAQYLQDWITDPEFPLIWRLKKEEAGTGAHGDINSHIIDLARYLVGDFAKVVGMQETFIKKRPELEVSEELTTGLTAESRRGKLGEVTVDDATLFLARFKNGALGSFEGTRLANGRRNGLRFEINGSKGSFLFELENMNELWFYSCEDPDGLQGFRKILATEAAHPYIEAWWPPGHIIGWGDTFVHLVYDFMKALDEDRMPTPNFADGVECQRVLEAVEKSVKEERWIDVEAKKK